MLSSASRSIACHRTTQIAIRRNVVSFSKIHRLATPPTTNPTMTTPTMFPRPSVAAVNRLHDSFFTTVQSKLSHSSTMVSSFRSLSIHSNSTSQLPMLQQLQQQRQFSWKANNKQSKPNTQNKKNAGGNSSSTPLANEKLIQILMKQSKSSSPEDVTVRLVIDKNQNPDTPNDVKVVTVSEAIQISIEENLDLIEANIKSDPPTIRCTKLSQLLYKREQNQKKKQQQQQQLKKSQKQKTFRFRSGIDDHDLSRKVDDIMKFLQLGMECEYTIFTKGYAMRSNPNAGKELNEKILEQVSQYGIPKRPPQISPTGNHIRCILEPKKQQPKQK